MLFKKTSGKRRTRTGALLLMLLVSVLAGMHLGVLVYAQYAQSVTIKADGSVEPSTAPIIRVGYIYTLTGDVNGSLTVERDDCIVNGAGHQVRRLTLNQVDNVKIVYFNVENTDSDANETGEGVVLTGVTDSVIAYNNVSGYDIGIYASGPEWDSINNRILGLNNVIAGNNITDNNSCGIYITCEKTSIVGNYIETNGNGIYLFLTRNNTVMGNKILNNSVGIHIVFSVNADYFYLIGLPENLIHYNTFENIQNVVNEGMTMNGSPLSNLWDDGEVGNYWSDYGGKDVDGDGVGDTPYVIDDLNQDNYPLMAPAVISEAPVELPDLPAAPSVALLNPVNMTYSDVSVPLDFMVDKQAAWMGYSLDGQDNVTVTENVTLTGLSDGVHTVTVYANDTFGFMGVSETVAFTVATFPTMLVTVAVAVTAAAVVSAGLLVYFKKRKR
jgi:parallel beta-helix repeat protein